MMVYFERTFSIVENLKKQIFQQIFYWFSNWRLLFWIRLYFNWSSGIHILFLKIFFFLDIFLENFSLHAKEIYKGFMLAETLWALAVNVDMHSDELFDDGLLLIFLSNFLVLQFSRRFFFALVTLV